MNGDHNLFFIAQNGTCDCCNNEIGKLKYIIHKL